MGGTAAVARLAQSCASTWPTFPATLTARPRMVTPHAAALDRQATVGQRDQQGQLADGDEGVDLQRPGVRPDAMQAVTGSQSSSAR